jgi:hypothetical protein
MPVSAGQLFHQKSASGEELAFVLQSLSMSAQQRQSRDFLLRASPVASTTASDYVQRAKDEALKALLEGAMHGYGKDGDEKSYSAC